MRCLAVNKQLQHLVVSIRDAMQMGRSTSRLLSSLPLSYLRAVLGSQRNAWRGQ
jgi:hypothetical protein